MRRSASTVLSGLDDWAIAELLRIAGPDIPPVLLVTELRHLGGAISRRPENGGAVGAYLLFTGTVAATPEIWAEGTRVARNIVSVMRGLGATRPYLNFVEYTDVDVRTGFDDLVLGAHAIPTRLRDEAPTA